MGSLLTQHDHRPVHRAHFDPLSSNQLSSTIIEAISTVEDESPLELTPLYETIDLEALEQLLTHSVSAESSDDFVVEFSVDNWDVTVIGDGQVLIHDNPTDSETAREHDR
ncbi:hypothetical protein EA462_03800 [Natrarchaeobius halalkaliphilus]|uniref:Halobacterial output domain-containing protein n=1 Tax=Natrarchaeobius halalkaliphilus TaxID=1679091 RepID=A0A3N6M546_9EURY|nr:HalOD1 output domain-containing protein [Natrarchaeobius halalkaliphilus]RQG91130.1 hypothetical protein EA462_03800 [Natrarchaeobius halalkaliphilus]